jgi:hypothetical protein
MDIVYGICVYYGYFREQNIYKHLEVYNQLLASYPSYTFKFIINLMIDNKHKIDRDMIVETIKVKFPSHIIFLNNYNYGGTIAGLYDTYEYLKKNNMYDSYIMYFEEDFYAINPAFLEISIKLLEHYIYIGEVTFLTKGIKSREHSKKIQHWTDGGYYFSSYEKFNTIYTAIGPFHKGNTTIKYNHQIDGIELGEVGFPTMIHNAGFQFIGIPRNEYFVHNEVK